MQLRRTRRAKERVPGFGPNPHEAGKSGFKVAKFYRAENSRQIGAE